MAESKNIKLSANLTLSFLGNETVNGVNLYKYDAEIKNIEKTKIIYLEKDASLYDKTILNDYILKMVEQNSEQEIFFVNSSNGYFEDTDTKNEINNATDSSSSDSSNDTDKSSNAKNNDDSASNYGSDSGGSGEATGKTYSDETKDLFDNISKNAGEFDGTNLDAFKFDATEFANFKPAIDNLQTISADLPNAKTCLREAVTEASSGGCDKVSGMIEDLLDYIKSSEIEDAVDAQIQFYSEVDQILLEQMQRDAQLTFEDDAVTFDQSKYIVTETEYKSGLKNTLYAAYDSLADFLNAVYNYNSSVISVVDKMSIADEASLSGVEFAAMSNDEKKALNNGDSNTIEFDSSMLAALGFSSKEDMLDYISTFATASAYTTYLNSISDNNVKLAFNSYVNKLIDSRWFNDFSTTEGGKQAYYDHYVAKAKENTNRRAAYDEYDAIINTEYINSCIMTGQENLLIADFASRPLILRIINDETGIFGNNFSYYTTIDDKELIDYYKEYAKNNDGNYPAGVREVNGSLQQKTYTLIGEQFLYEMDYHADEWKTGYDPENKKITAFSKQAQYDAEVRSNKGEFIQNYANYDLNGDAQRDWSILNGQIKDDDRLTELKEKGCLSFEDSNTILSIISDSGNKDLYDKICSSGIDGLSEKDRATFDKLLENNGFNEKQIWNFEAKYITNTLIDMSKYIETQNKDLYDKINELGYSNLSEKEQAKVDAILSSAGYENYEISSFKNKASAAGIYAMQAYGAGSLLSTSVAFWKGVGTFVENCMDAGITISNSNFWLLFGDEDSNLIQDTKKYKEMQKELADEMINAYKESGAYDRDYEAFKNSTSEKDLIDILGGDSEHYSGIMGTSGIGLQMKISSAKGKEKEEYYQQAFWKLKNQELNLNDASASSQLSNAIKLGIRSGDFSKLYEYEEDEQMISMANKQYSAMLDVAVDNVGNWVQGKIYSKDWYVAAEEASLVKKDNFLGLCVDQVGNMAIPVALSILIPPVGSALGASSAAASSAVAVAAKVASSAALWTSAFGGANQEAFNQGANYGDAINYSLLSATTELATEWMFGGIMGVGTGWFDDVVRAGYDKILGNITSNVIKNPTTRAIIEKLFINGIGEGVEEITTDLVTPLWRSWTLEKELSYKDILTRDVSAESLFETFSIAFVTSLFFTGLSTSVQYDTLTKNIDSLSKITKNNPGFNEALKNMSQELFVQVIENDGNLTQSQIFSEVIGKFREQIMADPQLKEAVEQANAELLKGVIKTDANNNVTNMQEVVDTLFDSKLIENATVEDITTIENVINNLSKTNTNITAEQLYQELLNSDSKLIADNFTKAYQLNETTKNFINSFTKNSFSYEFKDGSKIDLSQSLLAEISNLDQTLHTDSFEINNGELVVKNENKFRKVIDKAAKNKLSNLKYQNNLLRKQMNKLGNIDVDVVENAIYFMNQDSNIVHYTNDSVVFEYNGNSINIPVNLAVRIANEIGLDNYIKDGKIVFNSQNEMKSFVNKVCELGTQAIDNINNRIDTTSNETLEDALKINNNIINMEAEKNALIINKKVLEDGVIAYDVIMKNEALENDISRENDNGIRRNIIYTTEENLKNMFDENGLSQNIIDLMNQNEGNPNIYLELTEEQVKNIENQIREEQKNASKNSNQIDDGKSVIEESSNVKSIEERVENNEQNTNDNVVEREVVNSNDINVNEEVVEVEEQKVSKNIVEREKVSENDVINTNDINVNENTNENIIEQNNTNQTDIDVVRNTESTSVVNDTNTRNTNADTSVNENITQNNENQNIQNETSNSTINESIVNEEVVEEQKVSKNIIEREKVSENDVVNTNEREKVSENDVVNTNDINANEEVIEQNKQTDIDVVRNTASAASVVINTITNRANKASVVVDAPVNNTVTQNNENQNIQNETANDIRNGFNAMRDGIKEAGRRRVREIVKRDGYVAYKNDEAARLFEQNPEYKDWRHEVVDGEHRFYPPDKTQTNEVIHTIDESAIRNAQVVLETNSNIEVSSVESIKQNVSQKMERGFKTNLSYEGFDYVVKPKNSFEQALKEVIANNNGSNILIEISNTTELNLDLIETIPDNVKIRITGDYTIDYMDSFKSAQESGNGTLRNVTYTKEQLKNIMTEINEFEKGINPNWSDMQKARYAYDYLKNNIEYHDKNQIRKYSSKEGMIGNNANRLARYDGLVNLIEKSSTCQGFAATYQELLTRMGIDARVVPGSLNGEGQHAFNVVKVDGRTFIVDAVREMLDANSPGKYPGTGFNVENIFEYHTKNSYYEVIKETVLDQIAENINEIIKKGEYNGIYLEELSDFIKENYTETQIPDNLKEFIHQVDEFKMDKVANEIEIEDINIDEYANRINEEQVSGVEVLNKAKEDLAKLRGGARGVVSKFLKANAVILTTISDPSLGIGSTITYNMVAEQILNGEFVTNNKATEIMKETTLKILTWGYGKDQKIQIREQIKQIEQLRCELLEQGIDLDISRSKKILDAISKKAKVVKENIKNIYGNVKARFNSEFNKINNNIKTKFNDFRTKVNNNVDASVNDNVRNNNLRNRVNNNESRTENRVDNKVKTEVVAREVNTNDAIRTIKRNDRINELINMSKNGTDIHYEYRNCRKTIDTSLKEVQDGISQKYENTPNVMVLDSGGWTHIHIGAKPKISLDNAIKIYVPIDGINANQTIQKVTDFLIQNDIASRNKVGSYVKDDAFVLRVFDKNDAKKVINFINEQVTINHLTGIEMPLAFKAGDVSIAMDGLTSYNQVATILIDTFAKYNIGNDVNSFKEFIHAVNEQIINGDVNLFDSIFKEQVENIMKDPYVENEQIAKANIYEIVDIIDKAINGNMTTNEFVDYMEQYQNSSKINEVISNITGNQNVNNVIDNQVLSENTSQKPNVVKTFTSNISKKYRVAKNNIGEKFRIAKENVNQFKIELKQVFDIKTTENSHIKVDTSNIELERIKTQLDFLQERYNSKVDFVRDCVIKTLQYHNVAVTEDAIKINLEQVLKENYRVITSRDGLRQQVYDTIREMNFYENEISRLSFELSVKESGSVVLNSNDLKLNNIIENANELGRDVYGNYVGINRLVGFDEVWFDIENYFEQNKYNNLKVERWPAPSNFLNFTIGEETKSPFSNAIKMYIPINQSNASYIVRNVIEQLAKNNIASDNKISRVARDDAFVLRIYDVNDAYRIAKWINDNFDLDTTGTELPLCYKFGKISVAMDGQTSYNSSVADLIEYYAKINSENPNLKGFKDFIKQLKKEVILYKNTDILETIFTREYTNLKQRYMINFNESYAKTSAYANLYEVIDIIDTNLNSNLSVENFFRYLDEYTKLEKVGNIIATLSNSQFDVDLTVQTSQQVNLAVINNNFASIIDAARLIANNNEYLFSAIRYGQIEGYPIENILVQIYGMKEAGKISVSTEMQNLLDSFVSNNGVITRDMIEKTMEEIKIVQNSAANNFDLELGSILSDMGYERVMNKFNVTEEVILNDLSQLYNDLLKAYENYGLTEEKLNMIFAKIKFRNLDEMRRIYQNSSVDVIGGVNISGTAYVNLDSKMNSRYEIFLENLYHECTHAIGRINQREIGGYNIRGIVNEYFTDLQAKKAGGFLESDAYIPKLVNVLEEIEKVIDPSRTLFTQVYVEGNFSSLIDRLTEITGNENLANKLAKEIVEMIETTHYKMLTAMENKQVIVKNYLMQNAECFIDYLKQQLNNGALVFEDINPNNNSSNGIKFNNNENSNKTVDNHTRNDILEEKTVNSFSDIETKGKVKTEIVREVSTNNAVRTIKRNERINKLINMSKNGTDINYEYRNCRKTIETPLKEVQYRVNSMYKNMSNVRVIDSGGWTHIQIGTNPNIVLNNAIKIYVPIDGVNANNVVKRVTDFLIRNDIVSRNAIGSYVRDDAFLLRIFDVNDAKKVINFINEQVTLNPLTGMELPLTFKAGDVSICMDGLTSYNQIATTLIDVFTKHYMNAANGFNDFVHKLNKQIINGDVKLFDSIFKVQVENIMKNSNIENEQLVVANIYEIVDIIDKVLNDNMTINEFVDYMEQYQNSNKINEVIGNITGSRIINSNVSQSNEVKDSSVKSFVSSISNKYKVARNNIGENFRIAKENVNEFKNELKEVFDINTTDNNRVKVDTSNAELQRIKTQLDFLQEKYDSKISFIRECVIKTLQYHNIAVTENSIRINLEQVLRGNYRVITSKDDLRQQVYDAVNEMKFYGNEISRLSHEFNVKKNG